jgi:hypothetical protein
MNFRAAFQKSAGGVSSAAKGALETTKRLAAGAKEVGSGAVEGLKKSMNVPLGKHLNMSGVSHVTDAAKAHGGFLNSFKSRKGRAAMGEAMGKAAPSAAAGAGYLYGAKKVYDKTLGSSEKKNQSQYLDSYYNG